MAKMLMMMLAAAMLYAAAMGAELEMHGHTGAARTQAARATAGTGMGGD